MKTQEICLTLTQEKIHFGTIAMRHVVQLVEKNNDINMMEFLQSSGKNH